MSNYCFKLSFHRSLEMSDRACVIFPLTKMYVTVTSLNQMDTTTYKGVHKSIWKLSLSEEFSVLDNHCLLRRLTGLWLLFEWKLLSCVLKLLIHLLISLSSDTESKDFRAHSSPCSRLLYSDFNTDGEAEQK